MAEKPTLQQTFAGEDEFLSALETAEKLFRDGELRWRVKPDCSVVGSIDDAVLERAFDGADAAGQFKRILGVDISMAMTAAANDQPMHETLGFATHVLVGARISPSLSQEDKEFMSARLVKVKDTLFQKSLRERVLIRRTCKKEVLGGLRWDINIKKHDLGEGTLDDIPYATIALHTSETFDINTILISNIFMGQRATGESIVFDCHVDDLNDLIRDLTEIRDNLRLLTQTDAGAD